MVIINFSNGFQVSDFSAMTSRVAMSCHGSPPSRMGLLKSPWRKAASSPVAYLSISGQDAVVLRVPLGNLWECLGWANGRNFETSLYEKLFFYDLRNYVKDSWSEYKICWLKSPTRSDDCGSIHHLQKACHSPLEAWDLRWWTAGHSAGDHRIACLDLLMLSSGWGNDPQELWGQIPATPIPCVWHPKVEAIIQSSCWVSRVQPAMFFDGHAWQKAFEHWEYLQIFTNVTARWLAFPCVWRDPKISLRTLCIWLNLK